MRLIRLCLRRVGWWIYYCGFDKSQQSAKAARIEEALLVGFTAAGLQPYYLSNPHYDILQTGKFHEVEYYAGKYLGHDFRTLKDMRSLLEAIHDL